MILSRKVKNYASGISKEDFKSIEKDNGYTKDRQTDFLWLIDRQLAMFNFAFL